MGAQSNLKGPLVVSRINGSAQLLSLVIVFTLILVAITTAAKI